MSLNFKVFFVLSLFCFFTNIRCAQSSLFQTSLAQSKSSRLKKAHGPQKPGPHAKLIHNIHEQKISELLEQTSDYPWVKDYVFNILKTDLSFAQQIKDSKEKIELLNQLLDETHFAPLEKKLLEHLIKSKTNLKLSVEKEKKQIQKLTNQKPSKHCKTNYKKAKNFREFRKFNLSLKLYESAFNCYKSTKKKIRTLRQITLTHKLKHRGTNYTQASKRYYDFAKSSYKKKRLSAWSMNSIGISHARTLWTYKSWQSAKNVLDEMKSLLKDKISFQTIYWIEARLYEEKKQLKTSLKYIDLALKEKNLDQDDYLKLHWQKFWDNYKSKNFVNAEKTLRKAITLNDPDDGRSKLYYWLRKILQRKKSTPELKKEIKDIENTLLAKYPLSFYSALIRKSRESGFKPSDLADINSKTYQKLPKSFDLNLYKSLHFVSLPATQSFLEHYYSEYKFKISKAKRFLIKRLMARNGDTLNLFLDVKARPELCLDFESPCMDLFPSPYIRSVQTAAKKYDVPSELIYSIMRQESIFNPLAKSWADARGLMQLLPSLAKQLAPKLGIKYKSSLDLYNPNKNILLGTYHIKNLFKNNLQSTVLALCGYNADRKKALMWYKTRFQNDWLDFIEEIPYSETRAYNKLVLRNFMIYAKKDSSDFKKWFPQGL